MNSPAALDEEGDAIYITAGNVEMLYGLETKTGTYTYVLCRRARAGEGMFLSLSISVCPWLFFCVSVHWGRGGWSIPGQLRRTQSF